VHKLEDRDGGSLTTKDYMNRALAKVPGRSDVAERKNQVRKSITEFFQNRDCISIVRPLEDESQL
jgi:hypothetical protein